MSDLTNLPRGVEPKKIKELQELYIKWHPTETRSSMKIVTVEYYDRFKGCVNTFSGEFISLTSEGDVSDLVTVAHFLVDEVPRSIMFSEILKMTPYKVFTEEDLIKDIKDICDDYQEDLDKLAE